MLVLVLNVYSYAYDRPQPYNYEPVRCPRDPEQTRIRRNNDRRGEKLSCAFDENQRRPGQVSWRVTG